MQNKWRHQIVGSEVKVPTAQGIKTYTNFDNAATTPPLAGVMQAINDFAPFYASVHRGSGLKSQISTKRYEQARAAIADFVGVKADQHAVIFTKSTTESINKLSYRLDLDKQDIVLISHLEHHSNDLPWRAKATVKRIGLRSDGGIDQQDYLRLLRRYRGRIKLVALSGASNVTGHIPDIHWFAREAHAAGAQIFVDCAQLAAHRSIDVKTLDGPSHLDYIAFSGHKLYAPFGAGVLVGRHDAFLQGAPEYTGGGTIASVTTDAVDWALPPDKDEAGSPNVLGVIGLAAAVESLQKIGFTAIHKRETALTTYALQQLKTIQKLRIYGDQQPETAGQRSAVISFTMEGIPAHLVAACLGYEWGIGVRSGCFCAQPYVAELLKLNPEQTRRRILRGRRDLVEGLVRVSFGFYNTAAEIDRLVAALQAIASGNHQKYAVNRETGEWRPEIASV